MFHQEGSWAEVVSGFEYQKAIRNGVPGNLIIFIGPDKSKEDLILAVKNRSLIHIDHFDELYMLIEILEEIKDTKVGSNSREYGHRHLSAGTDLVSTTITGKRGMRL